MTQPDIFYMLGCRACAPDPQHRDMPLMMPFESPQQRGEWAAAHTVGTGHDHWLVIDLPWDWKRAEITRVTPDEAMVEYLTTGEPDE